MRSRLIPLFAKLVVCALLPSGCMTTEAVAPPISDRTFITLSPHLALEFGANPKLNGSGQWSRLGANDQDVVLVNRVAGNSNSNEWVIVEVVSGQSSVGHRLIQDLGSKGNRFVVIGSVSSSGGLPNARFVCIDHVEGQDARDVLDESIALLPLSNEDRFACLARSFSTCSLKRALTWLTVFPAYVQDIPKDVTRRSSRFAARLTEILEYCLGQEKSASNKILARQVLQIANSHCVTVPTQLLVSAMECVELRNVAVAQLVFQPWQDCTGSSIEEQITALLKNNDEDRTLLSGLINLAARVNAQKAIPEISRHCLSSDNLLVTCIGALARLSRTAATSVLHDSLVGRGRYSIQMLQALAIEERIVGDERLVPLLAAAITTATIAERRHLEKWYLRCLHADSDPFCSDQERSEWWASISPYPHDAWPITSCSRRNDANEIDVTWHFAR